MPTVRSKRACLHSPVPHISSVLIQDFPTLELDKFFLSRTFLVYCKLLNIISELFALGTSHPALPLPLVVAVSLPPLPNVTWNIRRGKSRRFTPNALEAGSWGHDYPHRVESRNFKPHDDIRPPQGRLRRAPLLDPEQISISRERNRTCLPEKEVIPIIWKNQRHSTILFALKLWSPSLHGWHLSGGRRSRSTFESILMRSASRGPSLKRCHLGAVKWRLISCFSQCTVCLMCWIQNEDIDPGALRATLTAHPLAPPELVAKGRSLRPGKTPTLHTLDSLSYYTLVWLKYFLGPSCSYQRHLWAAFVFFFASFSCRFTSDFQTWIHFLPEIQN